MVGRAQQDEVVEGGLPAVGPVPYVMAVQAMGGGAAGEAASTVAACKRTAHRGRDAAGAPPDAERLAVRAIDDRDDTRIAAQPPGSLRHDGGAVLDFAASRPAVGEHYALRRKKKEFFPLLTPRDVTIGEDVYSYGFFSLLQQ